MMKKIILCMFLYFCAYAKEDLIVLDPASVEILYMLGAEDNIKAIASLQHSNIYPAEKTQKLPTVGTFSNPSVEKIIALNPSLVILSSYSLALEPRLKDLNIKTLYLEALKLQDLEKNIKSLAKIVSKEKEAELLIAKVQKELQDLKKDPLNKSAIFLFSSNPLMAFSDNSMIADILRLIGIKNLTPQSQVQRPMISSEYILNQDPDMLLITLEAKDIQGVVDQNPLLKHTKAYANSQIFVYKNIYGLLRISPNITQEIKKFKQSIEDLSK